MASGNGNPRAHNTPSALRVCRTPRPIWIGWQDDHRVLLTFLFWKQKPDPCRVLLTTFFPKVRFFRLFRRKMYFCSFLSSFPSHQNYHHHHHHSREKPKRNDYVTNIVVRCIAALLSKHNWISTEIKAVWIYVGTSIDFKLKSCLFDVRYSSILVSVIYKVRKTGFISKKSEFLYSVLIFLKTK